MRAAHDASTDHCYDQSKQQNYSPSSPVGSTTLSAPAASLAYASDDTSASPTPCSKPGSQTNKPDAARRRRIPAFADVFLGIPHIAAWGWRPIRRASHVRPTPGKEDSCMIAAPASYTYFYTLFITCRVCNI